MASMRGLEIDRDTFDWDAIEQNDFWIPQGADTVQEWEDYLQGLRKAHDSVGAVISGFPTFRAVAERLNAAGLAVLRVDARGVGGR